ncbi:MAG: phosphoglycolate phosphatase [Pseudomonadota bacterium]
MSAWRQPYAAYLFDLDGTLIDTAPDLNLALNHCLAQAGLPGVDEAHTRHWVGHGARVLIEQALHHHQIEHPIEPLFEAFLAFYVENVAVQSRFYPTVEDTLKQLRECGAQLAVVTNKLAHFSERLLQELGAREYFDTVIGGDTASAPKPDPAPIELCLQHLGVGVDDALFVGDSETDVRAAQAAGMRVVCLRDGYNHGIDVSTLHPDAVIDRFAELL